MILHSAFGNTGTAAAPFNLGRTATHEIGHWLNLRHIWGDDGPAARGSDFVADTPNAAGPNFGTPTFPHVTCNNGPNGDMFMNYMDYTDDVGDVHVHRRPGRPDAGGARRTALQHRHDRPVRRASRSRSS